MAEVKGLPALDAALDDIEGAKRACAAFRDVFERLRSAVGRVMVGQDEVVEQTLMALFADGHVLLEGVPGLGKTLLVQTLSRVLHLPFARIQFTPDLMPADITGTAVVLEDPTTGRRSFTFRPGPIFHQLVLADEINRATPKSQAALLEAMQERSVSIAGKTHALARPFFVMATQNPIEQEGTYALPEAQLDRFLFKVLVPYTTREELNEIMRRTTAAASGAVAPIVDGSTIQQGQRLGARIIVAEPVQDYAIRLVLATHPGGPHADPDLNRYISVGVSPRGAQALVRAAKIKALIDGRYAACFRDLHAIAGPCLRHRIIRSFEAEADGVSADAIVDRLIDWVPREAPDLNGQVAS
ncbi:MAG: AAA family ATPase [Planctomycetota bacterium]|jgi:MoxR-like ATPase